MLMETLLSLHNKLGQDEKDAANNYHGCCEHTSPNSGPMPIKMLFVVGLKNLRNSNRYGRN